MRFNFKKIASVLASAAMLGSTMGMAAAAATYPDPYIKGGVANVAVVVGASAATIDNIAAVDVGANLQEELAKQTATTTTTGATGTGGDSVNLATSSQKLYYNSTLNAARTSITNVEMPTILADGKVIDDSGTEYSYRQTVTPGNKTIGYSTSGGDLSDPELLIVAGTTADDFVYQYDITFNKNINLTHADVQGNNIQILGRDFTIGASSTSAGTSPVLYLYGAGTEKTVNEGETATIEVGGKSYSVELKSVEQTGGVNYVSLSLDGGSIRRIQEGNSAKVGDLEIYAKTVHYLAKEAQVSYADLNIGSKKIKIGGSAAFTTIKEGADETSIYGTAAKIATSNGLCSGITIKVAMKSATKDYISAGGSFEDPIFGGLTVKFADVVPTLDADARDNIVIDSDNNRNAKVAFTSALAGEAGEKTIYFAHDQDSSESTVTTLLADQSNYTIHVKEGEEALINEYVVINAGDYGRIVKVTELPSGAFETTSKIQLEDIITGKQLFDGGLTIGTDGWGSTNIDGSTYYMNLTRNASVNGLQITWGSTASQGYVGTETTLYPRIKTAKGGWIAFLKSANITNTTYSLPGIQTLSTYESGLAVSNLDTHVLSGNVNYIFNAQLNDTTNVTANATLGATQIIGIDVTGNGILDGSDCLFNGTVTNVGGAAILFVEEKKTTETGNANNGDVICVNVDLSGSTSPTEMSVSTPKITNVSSGLVSLTSDSNLQEAVTRYGSFVEYDSTDNDKVTIKYPDEQMYADVLFTAVGVEVSSGGAGGSVASLGSVAVMDSEVATVSSKNLIVIGGSCINTVAAKVLGSDTPLCGADFTAKTNITTGQFLIKVVDSPYTTGKVAMLVAGYEGADTRKAATYLTANKPATVVGTTLKKQTATYADVV
jgi:hypothetical protein